MAAKLPRPQGRPVRARPDYLRIAELLREKIRSGVWPNGFRLPSLLSLAAQFGVGERTIRDAMDALKSEGWVGSSARRRLVAQTPIGSATTTTGLILEVVPSKLGGGVLNSTEGAELQRGIGLGASDLDAPLLIVHAYRLQGALPEDCLQYPLRGIVLLSGAFQRQVYRAYERLHLPVVLVDRPDRKWKLHACSVDNVAAAHDATTRLLALGHRRIAFLRYIMLKGKDIDPDSREREQGYRLALQAAARPGARGWVYNSFDADKPESPVIQAILRARPAFTAVLAVDAARAGLVIQAAQAAGLNVPRDLSVVCFQGQAAPASHLSGPRVDFAELGRQAMHLLKLPRNPPQHLRIPAIWAEGETVAPARK